MVVAIRSCSVFFSYSLQVVSTVCFIALLRNIMAGSCLKVVYYLGVIANHIADNVFDWKGYMKSGDRKEFSAIPKDSPTSDDFYLVSCISGTLFSLLILGAYCYFIEFHVTERNRQDCKRGYLEYELFVSVCQLLFKDAIQSVLMFLNYLSDDAGNDCASLLTKQYAICSVVSHSKLLICFATKLFKYGSGENYDSDTKCCFCFLGCLGALTLVVFTSLYLAIIESASTCLPAPTVWPYSQNLSLYTH